MPSGQGQRMGWEDLGAFGEILGENISTWCWTCQEGLEVGGVGGSSARIHLWGGDHPGLCSEPPVTWL